MKPQFTFPQYQIVQYQKGDNSQWYELTGAPPTFNRLPFDLKVEDCQRKKIVQAEIVLTGRVVNGKRTFFTGLRETGQPRYLYGDQYQRGKKNLIIVSISENTRHLTVFYFRGFYPKGDKQKENLFTEFFNRLRVDLG